MNKRKKKRTPSPSQLRELAALEDAAAAKGIRIHYDRLEAAGLRIHSGHCTLKGEVHLYVEKRKSLADKIDFIKEQLEQNISSV